MINFIKILKKNPINPAAPKKTYAQAQTREVKDMAQLAQHMAEHNCPHSEGTIIGVLTDTIKCIKEQLLNGNVVRLGDLGMFRVSLSSNGVCESIVDNLTGEKPVFTANDITAVNVRWVPGDRFENLIAGATFKQVETMKKTAKGLKEKQEQLAAGTYVGDNPKTPGVSEIE